MPKAQRSVVVAVPPEKLFAVVTDYGHYADFIPEMRVARVVREAGPVKQVEFEIEVQLLGFARRVRYTLEFTETAPTGVRWHLVASDTIKENNGSWTLRPAGEGKTEAVYEIELKLGALVPRAISTFLAEQSLPKLLDQFKGRAESR